MGLEVSRVKVWAASLKDKPGSAAEKLDALAAAGANLEFVIARRTDKGRNQGVIFVAELTGAKQAAAARKAGFAVTKSLHSVRACPILRSLNYARPTQPGCFLKDHQYQP